MPRRALLLIGCAFAAGAASAQAADAPAQKYAVLSIIGDQMSTVWYRESTGSNLDKNEHQQIPTNSAAFDNVALLAADDAIRRISPKAAATLMSSRDPALYASQEKMLDHPADAAELLGAIKGLLQKSQATRLILISKHRSEARFQLRGELIGSGKISGLGFYVDQQTRISLTQGGDSDTGFIAPYAYLAVSLIDARTMTTIRRVTVTESDLVPTAAAKDAMRPWDALTPKQKGDALEALIGRALDRAVPEVLAGQ